MTESESDNPEMFVELKTVTSKKGLALIQKKRTTIKRRARRLCEKLPAEKRYLARKVSKRTSKTLKESPDIGEKIEAFVRDCNVGADAWCRTGILTSDGSVKLKIKKYLEEVYGRTFAYSTVIQLCMARNKRRLSSKRYRGLAKVTSRRARKGFNLRFNPDAHWSSSLYK